MGLQGIQLCNKPCSGYTFSKHNILTEEKQLIKSGVITEEQQHNTENTV